MHLIKPKADEYASYFEAYVSKVGEGSILDILAHQKNALSDYIRQIPIEKADFAYAEGKWTIKQVINHINDVERVFTYRAMSLSRNEANPIASFDHNAYVDAVDVSNRGLADLADEFEAIRESTIQFFKNLPDQYAIRQGLVSNQNCSVRALAYISAGHALHHQKILNERYFSTQES